MNSYEMSNFIWDTANLIYLPVSPCKVQDVILPFTVLHRVDYILESAKDGIFSITPRATPSPVSLETEKFKLRNLRHLPESIRRENFLWEKTTIYNLGLDIN